MAFYERIAPRTFEPARHFYPRVLNAQIHPLVRYFLDLSNERIAQRYVHLNPRVDYEQLLALLKSSPRLFRWAGCDLLHVTDEEGRRRMVVVETNSCPSGQKSMPLVDEAREQGGYRTNIESTFMARIKGKRLPNGEVAVIFDKNPMEASGYAAVMAELFDEPVHLVGFPDAPDPRVRFDDGVMSICDDEGRWRPIRCAFRYVTQRPWNRIPVQTKTVILNPVLTCLAGGRNKMVAAKAYDFFNAELSRHGMEILTPQTYWDVSANEIPLWVSRLGGLAVVKVPYSNAGQGVYTLTTPAELDAFMKMEHRYERFIVQSLIGNAGWTSSSNRGRLYHVGTVPNKRGEIFVADLRVMVGGGADGFRPLAIYARRARQPLAKSVDAHSSWDMLGTNLSVKREDGEWDSESNRLLLMDRRDFNRLGVGLDELIEGYVQTVLSVLAIDRMAVNLTKKGGGLKRSLFRSLNDDPVLQAEIMQPEVKK